MFRKSLILSLLLSALIPPALAQDKSASSIVQTPTAGGTVTREEGTFTLNNNTGSANFRLPFPELPQRGRFGPQMVLTYNQFAGDSGSGLGVGWGLSVPSIAVNQDMGTAIPGTKPDGDFFSRLNFMGARLVFQGAENGVWHYRPEVAEEFIRVTYHPQPFEVMTLDRTGAQVVETIPSGFQVLNPDGSQMIFSGDPAVAEVAAGTVTRWPMVIHMNADRDPIRYTYTQAGGRSYLTAISFAGGQSVYAFDLIETRPSLVSHVTGTRQQNAMLYGRMTARFGDAVRATWCFGYVGRALDDAARFAVRAHPACMDKARADLEPLIDGNSVNVLDQLRVVYRFGDTGDAVLGAETEKFPDIRFDYSSWTAAELADRDLVYEAPRMAFAGDIPPQNFELADMNMDALVDVVRTTDNGATVLLGEGDLGNAFGTSAPLVLSRSTDAGLMRDVIPRLADDRFQFADIIGDSFVDLVELETGAIHIFDGKADGTFAHLGRSIPLPAVSPTTFAGGNGRFQDLNLDGRSDIVTTRLNADGQTEWQIFLNLTRRQDDGSQAVNFGALNKPFPFASQDGQILGRGNVRLADVNGDRLPDFVVIRPADRGFCLYENQGNLFSPDPGALLFGDASLNDPLCGAGRFAAIGGMEVSDNLQTMWYVDVNGDGILDFAAMGARTDQLRVWLGFGDGSFLPDPLNLDLNLRVQTGAASNSFRSRVADIDADGQSEIIVFQKPSGTDVRAVVVLDFNRTADMQLVKANLLTVVEFDSGRRHDLRYATSIDEMLRDRANSVPTRNLHFPVVVAKQMVTSQGIPGQARSDVTTEEYFYHQPFYDVINHRFIGFAEVEKVVYGDEFAAGRVTQKSLITREKFYAFAEVTADLQLAGKMKQRKTYEVVSDPVVLASAAATQAVDPAEVTAHSLSTATRRQGLPATGRLLMCEAALWQTVANGPGTAWLRKVEDQRSDAVAPGDEGAAADETCINPLKSQAFSDFDEFNLPRTETVTLREVAAPEGVIIPATARTTTTDYAASRQALAGLGIVDAVSERRTLSGSRVMSRELFDYLPENGGRMGTRTLEVFSSLTEVPAQLAAHHNPTHALTRRMDHDAFGNVIAMSDDMGMIESVAYDETGTLAQVHTKVAGGDAQFDQISRSAYDPAGRMVQETTPLGMVIDYEYDSLGRKIVERAADGAEKRYVYRIGEGGLPSLILTAKRRYPDAASVPQGESEWIEEMAAFNATGNAIAQIENVAEGGVRVFKFALYNRNDKLVFRWTPFIVTEFNGQPVANLQAVLAMGDIPRPQHEVGNAYTYDGAGRMVRETHPAGKVSEMSFEPWGSHRITRYDDQFDGAVATEELRVSNENGIHATIIGNTAGQRHVTRFDRDARGYLAAIHLPGEATPRRVAYNSIGDLEFSSAPGIGDSYHFYDARGRQVANARVAADGQTRILTSVFDFQNRKVSETEDGTLRVEITYDAGQDMAALAAFATPVALPLGQITRVVSHDPNGRLDSEQRFGYDANGRMVQNQMTMDGTAYAESFHQTLDGRIDQSTGPGGLSSQFALGPDRNLRSVTIRHPDLAGPESVIDLIRYNAEGRIARIDYRGGAFTDLIYDPATLFLSRIVSAAGDVPLQDLTMTFNGNGSITRIEDGLAARDPGFGHVLRDGAFRYDFKNQLVRIDRYGEVAEFAYSQAGAFTRNDEFARGASLAPAADAVTGLLPTGTADAAYRFDGFGQLAASPMVQGTVFDAYGRLIRAQTATAEVFYGYDQTGRRTYKDIVPADGSAPVRYLYPMQSYEVGPQGAESYVHIGDARLVRMEHGTGRWFYYLKDHLESSDYLIASDGVPVEQMLYRAFGTEHKPEVLSPAWGQHLVTVAADVPRERTHHRFTGKYLDDETGLYYYGARYYDPALGRFISPDPLYMGEPERCTANVVGCGLYAYANNNPLAFIDPTGLDGVVAGDAAYRRQVEESLNRIDPTARVDSTTGEISQSWLHGAYLDVKNFFVPGTDFAAGRELIGRVVDSPQTTTIRFDPGNAAADRADPSVDWTTTPGDAVVDYDPAHTPLLPEFDAATGVVSDVAVDPGIAIGHELIHATHIMAGQVSGLNPVTYTGLDGNTFTARFDEEARTVGVGGTPRADDITENDLRRMNGIDQRNNY